MRRPNTDPTGFGLTRTDWVVLVSLIACVIMIADWGLLSGDSGSAWGGRPAWLGFLSFVVLITASSLAARAFWNGWHYGKSSPTRRVGLIVLWFVMLAGAFAVIEKASERRSRRLPQTLVRDEQSR